MIINSDLPFIQDYINSIDMALIEHSERGLSSCQKAWLKLVIMGILLTNSICWAKFSRHSLGKYTLSGLSWMFCKSKLVWENLLKFSTLCILRKYGIKGGVLVLDDTSNERSRNTKSIARVHKVKDKRTSGYFQGQSLVFLILVCNEFTIPVGFKLYAPNPEMINYNREYKKYKKDKVNISKPIRPNASTEYPTKLELGLSLVEKFTNDFPKLKVKAVVMDALYCKRSTIERIANSTLQAQVITQIRCNQLLLINNKKIAVKDAFDHSKNITMSVNLRGLNKNITLCNQIAQVKSHKNKYQVIALKYDNEVEYRYLIASNLNWQALDIIKAYALRWLVEVFIQDWKSNEGWSNLAKQRGVDGSIRGIILSLLSDHALLLHPQQQVLFNNKVPAATVGSLRQMVIIDSLMAFIKDIAHHQNPKQEFEKYSSRISEIFTLMPSKKHMREVDFETFQSHNIAA